MRPLPERLEAQRARVSGHVALVVVQLCFGLFPVFGLLAMDPRVGFSAAAVAAWRVAAGALVLGGLAWWRHGAAMRVRRADLPRFAACALTGVVLNQGLYLLGLERSNATNAGLMMALIPVFTFVLAVAVGLERLRWVRALGVLIAFAGTAPLIFARGGADLFGEYGFGNLLMVLNTLCYAIYLVLSKPLTERYPPLVLIGWSYLLSVPMLAPFLWGEPLGPADPALSDVWASLAYVIVFPTVVGYFLNIYALARVRASTTAIYIYSQPLISGVAGALVLDERPTPMMAAAAVALFVGIWLVSRRPPTGGPNTERTDADP